MEDKEVNPYTYGHVWPRNQNHHHHHNNNKTLSRSGADQFGSLHKEECKWIYIYHPTQNSSPSGSKSNIKLYTLNLMETEWRIPLNTLVQDNFLKRTPKAHVLRLRINKWDLIKLKSVYKAKDINHRIKWQPSEKEKSFINFDLWQRVLIPKIH